MALVVTYPVDLECPRCRRTGEGDATETMGLVDRYTVLPVSGGFAMVHSSAIPETAIVRCQCGFEFYA
jgi:hypothetical protein